MTAGIYWKMKFVLLAGLHTLAGLQGHAQTVARVFGTIADENDIAIPFANKAVYNSSDEKLLSGAVSDSEGNFSIPLKPGNYFLNITFLSYEERTIPALHIKNGDIDLGTLKLKLRSQVLETVTV